jgi:hypothetical protein
MSTAIVPRCALSIRPAVAGDYAFIDRLAKLHSRNLGFSSRSMIEGKIRLGEVLIAEDETKLPIGYCMSSNRYLKRDELGVIYQMNVMPGKQRKLVGAMLLKEVFERAPYGCKLFCCWCRQDLSANYFWESMGFIPLAFRADAKGKYAHIFWQRRIREGDVTTPYWFPSKTDGGMMREDRLVLPIPAGVHWTDVRAVSFPSSQAQPRLEDRCPDAAKEKRKQAGQRKPYRARPTPVAPQGKAAILVGGRIRYMQRAAAVATAGDVEPTPLALPAPAPGPAGAQKQLRAAKPRREKVKADPAHVAAARELRDRYLEQFNSGLVLPAGKYEVSRQLPIEDRQSSIANSSRPKLLEQKAA